MKKFQSIRRNYPPLVFSILLITIWQFSTMVFIVPNYILPSPFLILSTFINQIPILCPHLGITLFTALLGLIISIFIAILIAILMDLFPIIKNILYPYLVISQTVPIVFIYPLFLIWFGFGITAKILVVILVCFFPISVNLYDGFSMIDPDLISLFKSMGASKRKIIQIVKFPGALPNLFSGLKIAATYSIMGAVIGEWLGASKGIGIYMIRSYKTFRTDQVFAAILIVVILSLVLFQGIKFIEKKLIYWNNPEGDNL